MPSIQAPIPRGIWSSHSGAIVIQRSFFIDNGKGFSQSNVIFSEGYLSLSLSLSLSLDQLFPKKTPLDVVRCWRP